VESPLLLSAQGLALDRDERTLYVADYAIANSQREDSTTTEGSTLPSGCSRSCCACGFDSPAGRN
jgi:sugar lactone lactonase YvrE